jgi:hypothetical protein
MSVEIAAAAVAGFVRPAALNWTHASGAGII